VEGLIILVNARFLYMKLLGFFTAIVGFSYSLTSFFNFFEVVFESKITPGGINIWISGIGLLFPLFVFVLGVFFYFYADVFDGNRSKLVLVAIIINVIINVICIIPLIFKEIFISNMIEFIHFSFGYILVLLNIFFLYGKYNYKY